MSYAPTRLVLDVTWSGSAAYAPSDTTRDGWFGGFSSGENLNRALRPIGISAHTTPPPKLYGWWEYPPPHLFVNGDWSGAPAYTPTDTVRDAFWTYPTSDSTVYYATLGEVTEFGTPACVYNQSVGASGFYDGQVAEPFVEEVFFRDASWAGSSVFHPEHILLYGWWAGIPSGTHFTLGWESNRVGEPSVRNGASYILAPGELHFATGTADVSNVSAQLLPGGIAPTSAIGTPLIAYRIRYLTPGGIAPAGFGTTVVQNWIRYLTPTGAAHSAYGTPVLTRGVRSLAPAGINSALYGTPSVDNKTRYYNLLGWTSSIVATGARVWDGKQYAINVTLGDGMFVPGPIVSFPALPPDDTQTIELSGQGMSIPDNQVWPLHKIENRNKQAFPEGFTSYGLGAPRVDQTIYLTIRPLGADWSVFGTPFVDQTIKKLYPEGFTSQFVPASHQIYNYRIDVVAGGLNSYVSGAHTVLRGTARPIVPGIAPTSVVPTGLRVEYRIRAVAPAGFIATQWGTALLQNRNVWTYPGGIAPPSQTDPTNGNRQIPNPWISYRVRSLTGAGNINTFRLVDGHVIAHWIQYVDQAGYGIPVGAIGTARIEFRYRTIFPTFTIGTFWGNTTVRRRLFVEPVGWDSSSISTQAELLINTRRIYLTTGEADPTLFGQTRTFNWRQDIGMDRLGWYDTQWNFPIVYNLTQHVTVAPFSENIDPDEWPHYEPVVGNKDRIVGAFGHQSSRFSLSTWIRNNAVPVYARGGELTLWGGGTFIAHRNRTVQAHGFDSFYNEKYSVVWNAADALAPAGIPSGNFGRPDPVANLNRTVKQHSGWLGPVVGMAFAAYRIRSVAPSLFYDVPASYPEVRFNPFPIAPAGIPWQGQVGRQEIRTFIPTASPKSVNVHDPWIGEPIVATRNRSIAEYGMDQSEWGRPTIANFIQYAPLEGLDSLVQGAVDIAFRTKHIEPLAMAAIAIAVLHRIRNVIPDPPAQQVIDLSKYDRNSGKVEDVGYGISSLVFVSPKFWFPTIYPEGIKNDIPFGKPTVYSTALQPQFIFQDGLVGTPTIIFTQYVYPKWEHADSLVSEQARMTPWHIYAPSGDQTPPNFHPLKNGFAHPIGARTPDPWNGMYTQGYPWFGRTVVTNQNRAIGPVPRHFSVSGDMDYYPKYGTPTLYLRRQYVYPEGKRSLRFGWVMFLNVPQYVNLDDKTNPQGIANQQQWGVADVHFPPVPPDPNKHVFAVGSSQTMFGNPRVELFNRTIVVQGIPHRGNPQIDPYNATPWGVPLIGYPRTFVIGGGDVSRYGTAIIEYLNRAVLAEGWNNCSLEDDNFDDYRFPMKFTRINPPVEPDGIEPSSGAGTPDVSHGVRTVYGRGVASYNSGDHSVKASTQIVVAGIDSLVIGDIDRWEAGKVKAHGDDSSLVAIPRIRSALNVLAQSGGDVGEPRIGTPVYALNIPPITFAGPSVSNPFGCTNRVVIPLPILSSQDVPEPELV